MNAFIILRMARTGPGRREPATREPARPRAATSGESLRERNKREKRARLLRAARELFERRGFEGATARAICRRARIGTGTLFLYARDKRELLRLAFEEDARALWTGARARSAEHVTLVEALLDLFGAFIAYYDAHPTLARSLAAQLFASPEGGAAAALDAEFLGHVTALVERAQERGELRRDHPAALLATACFAHYTWWLLAWLVTRSVSRAEAEAGLRETLQLQLEGLRARPAPPGT